MTPYDAIPQVKVFLLKHLPIYKFTDGLTDGDLVSSVYFDNHKRELYQVGRHMP